MSFTFDQQSANRIARTVKRVEGTPVDRRPPRRAQSQSAEVVEVFKITGSSGGGVYSGVRQEWNGTSTWSNATGATAVDLLHLPEQNGGTADELATGTLVTATLTYGTGGADGAYVINGTSGGGGMQVTHVRIDSAAANVGYYEVTDMGADGLTEGDSGTAWLTADFGTGYWRLAAGTVCPAILRLPGVWEILGISIEPGDTINQVLTIDAPGVMTWDLPRWS